MSTRTLCRILGDRSSQTTVHVFHNVNGVIRVLNIPCTASYSKRSNSEDIAQSFKVVKSKARVDNDYQTSEGGPNWELLSPRANRFFFPNAIGPAWQGANTTIHTEMPLSKLIDFGALEKKPEKSSNKLKFSICVCPMLIKNSLHELFPAPEVVTNKTLTLLTLGFDGVDIENGAAKFVLAARELSERLRLHGYWADFMNPFSGKPFYSWANGKNLYKMDHRFRGLNVDLTNKNRCTVISSARNNETFFSGCIYTTAPSDYEDFKIIIEQRLYGNSESV